MTIVRSSDNIRRFQRETINEEGAVQTASIQYKTKPFAHQAEALNRWRGKPRFALFCEMGTGKTWIAINRAAELRVEDDVTEVLVIAPRSLLKVWEAEVGKHCPVPFETLILDRPKNWALLAKKPLDNKTGEPLLRFVMVNYEQLLTKRFPDLLNYRFGLAILDESTMVKNSFAKRSKKTKILVDRIPRAVLLTGNPAPNGPLDLYSQFLILDPHILGYTNYYPFRNRYSVLQNQVVRGKTIKLVVGYREDRIEKELRPRMAPYVFQILKSECLDLPPKIYTTREVYMGPEQARAYRTMRDQAVAEFKGGRLTAPVVLARMTRLSQISGGFFPNPDDGSVTPFSPNPKLLELEKVLDEMEGKFILWTRFRAELYAVERFLTEKGIKTVRLDGDVPIEERQAAVDKFQNDPNVRGFIGITSCGKFGLTLTEARTMIYYSNSYEFEVRNQSEDRAHRAGLKHPVTYVDLVMAKTVDNLILKALKAKENLSDFIKNLTAEEAF